MPVAVWTPSAQAQPYRCVHGTASYHSARPCPPEWRDKLGQIGPAEVRTRPTYDRTKTLQRAPEHFKYLGRECATLHDAIRTAPSRGIGREVINDLRAEYEQKCREDEQVARVAAGKDRKLEREERLAALSQDERMRDEARREQAHCDGLRDVIQSRRARLASLNESDLASLRRVEATFNQRCVLR